jgi:transposase
MSTEAVQFKSFIGVDLHKCTVTLRAVDPDGRAIGGLTCSTKCVEKIHSWLLQLPRPSWMAVEACPFAEWFLDAYRGDVDRLDIADATELAHRRGKRRKNDPNDAADIAVRLSRGQCPLGWIADEDTLRLRKLGRHWWQLSRTLARAKTTMRFLLLSRNVRGPQLDGASAQKWLLAHGHLLRDESRLAFANFVDLVNVLERQREQLHRRITLANRSQRFEQIMTVVKSVPGIDEIWACIIVAEIGDFSRFPNADTLEFWSGLTADNRTSAGKSRAGHITKAGSRTLRWALCCAARCLARHDRRQRDIRLRILRQCGGKKAKAKANTAMGRRLLRTLFAMVRDGTLYEHTQPVNHLANANRARRQKRQALASATE